MWTKLLDKRNWSEWVNPDTAYNWNGSGWIKWWRLDGRKWHHHYEWNGTTAEAAVAYIHSSDQNRQEWQTSLFIQRTQEKEAVM